MEINEATTIKARAQAAAKALKGLLSDKTLPEALKTASETLYQSLKKTWSDLEGDAGTDETSEALEAERYYGEMRNLLDAAVKQAAPDAEAYVQDFDGENAIVSNYKQGTLLSYPYTIDEQGKITLGTPVAVRSRNVYEPVTEAAMREVIKQEGDEWVLYASDGKKVLGRYPSKKGAEDREKQIEFLKRRKEAAVDNRELGGEYVPLMEAVRKDGSVLIKLIRPGKGSSGFYPVETLKRDGPKVFKKGLKMYWNHPTEEEEAARPEGDLDNLAGVLETDARWMDKGPTGQGLYADAQVFEKYQQAVGELAPHIGVSIRAYGRAESGKEGEGPVIAALTSAKSVDYVTEPGAGGQVLSLFEAARTRTEIRVDEAAEAAQNLQEADMEEVTKLQEAVAGLQKTNDEQAAQIARQAEAMAMRDAKDMVREALEAVPNLPDVTKRRLIESLAKNPPMKDGALDKASFGTAIQEAVKAEVEYLAEAAGLGKITDLGESEGGDGGEDGKLQESLEKSFQDIGLSEKAAKTAAQGRE